MPLDFHTHRLDAPAGLALINMPQSWLLAPHEAALRPGALYTAGIHPWWTVCDEATLATMLEGIRHFAERGKLAAIGECGLDRLRGAALSRQEAVFSSQVALAQAYALPVTVHCVRAFDRLLYLHKRLRPTTQWTVHGFRGAPPLAEQLLQAGFDLSFGAQYNAQSYALTPPERRRRESDAM